MRRCRTSTIVKANCCEMMHINIYTNVTRYFSQYEAVEHCVDCKYVHVVLYLLQWIVLTVFVVADAARTDKTICLAVSPSLKKYGIPGRPRLFEVKQKLNEANARRRSLLTNKIFYDSSYDAKFLEDNPHFAIDYIIVPPRMALYVEYSTRIYQVYLRHVAPEDIHVCNTTGFWCFCLANIAR